MDVAFRIRRADIRKLQELAAREKHSKDCVWMVFARIGESIGHFQVAHTSVDFPIHGLIPGLVKFPITVLGDLRFKTRRKLPSEVELGFSSGVFSFGDKSTHDEQILVGMPIDDNGVVIYPSELEKVVLARALSKERMQALGIERLLQGALARLERTVQDAHCTLYGYQVPESRIEEIVEESVRVAEPGIRAKYTL